MARQNSVLFLTASDYLDVNRLRASLMRKMADLMSSVDVYVLPFDYADYTPNPVATLNTAVTNLTASPAPWFPTDSTKRGIQPASRLSAACSARRLYSPWRSGIRMQRSGTSSIQFFDAARHSSKTRASTERALNRDAFGRIA